MALYKIHLNFASNPADGDYANISISGDTFAFDFKASPTVGEVQVGIEVEQTLNNTRFIFENFMNLEGLYTSLVGFSDYLEIVANSDTIPTLISSGPFALSYTIETQAISITAITIQNATSDFCNKINIDVLTSVEAVKLLSPYSDLALNSSSFTLIDQNRVANVFVSVEDADGNVASANVATPGILNASLINVIVNVNNVSVVNNSTLLLSYSIDNINWNETGNFNNLAAASYTMYIKDSYGCNITKSFIIEQGVGVEPVYPDYFKYSKANPIVVAKREQWNNYDILKNSYNTLSCEEGFEDIVYVDKHFYIANDTFTLQFKTTYNDLKLILSDNTQLVPTKISNNIGLKDSLDAKTTILNNSEIGIYFTSGKQYDYDTGAEIGTHALNGELPDFGKEGNFITVNNFNYEIKRVEFNYDVNAYVLIVTSTITDVDVITRAIYNILDYEVYEQIVSVAGKELFNFEIYYNSKINYASELIKVIEHTSILIKLVYSMSKNTDIFFNSGFEGKSRYLIDTIKSGTDNDSEKYNTDTEFYQINSNNFEVDIFKFLPLTKQLARQLELALSHDIININGINYIKDSIEKDPLERSNLYVVIATMKVKEGDNLTIGDNASIDIELINYDGTNFIKID